MARSLADLSGSLGLQPTPIAPLSAIVMLTGLKGYTAQLVPSVDFTSTTFQLTVPDTDQYDAQIDLESEHAQ